MVLERRQGSTLRAQIPMGDGMVRVSLDLDDLTPADRYDDAAESPAAPAHTEVFSGRGDGLARGHRPAARSAAAATAFDISMASAVLYMSSS
jgi:hypothetical protein